MPRTLPLCLLLAALAAAGCAAETNPKSDPEPKPGPVEPDPVDPTAKELTLRAVAIEGARLHDAAAPAPITLRLEVEGTATREQPLEVAFTFGEEVVTERSLYDGASLAVQPPARPDHRGLVALAVTLDGTTVTIADALSYAAAPTSLGLPGAPVVTRLPGVARADEGWLLDQNTLLVRQRPTPAAPPPAGQVLEASLHTFTAVRLEADKLTPLGTVTIAPPAGELALTPAFELGRDGRTTTFLPRAGPDGATELVSLTIDGDALTTSPPLARFPAGTTLLSAASRAGVLWALTRRLDAEGKVKVELHDVRAGKIVSSPAFDVLQQARIVPVAKGATDPTSLTLIGWRPIDGKHELALVDDATIEGGQLTGAISTIDGPFEERPIDVTLAVDGDKRWLAFAHATRGGLKVVVGALERARTVPTVVPAIDALLPASPHVNMFGAAEQQPPAARGDTPSLRMIRADYCGDGVSSTRVGQLCGTTRHLRPAVSSAWVLTLPVNGDKTKFEAVPLQTGATPPPGVPAFGAAGPFALRVEGSAAGRSTITALQGDTLVTWTNDASRSLSQGEDGRIVAGARHLVAAARLARPGDFAALELRLEPPGEGQSPGTTGLQMAIIGAVLGLNNTKKEPAAPDLAALVDVDTLTLDGTLAVAAQLSGKRRLIYGAEGTRIRQTRHAAFVTVPDDGLDLLETGVAPIVGVDVGLTFLPEGFVVDEFVAHGDELFFLGVRDGAAREEGERYDGSLFHVTTKALAAGEIVTPTELLGPSALRAGAIDETAAFAGLIPGDLDPVTDLPGLIVLTTTRPPLATARLHAPLVLTKELDASRELTFRLAPGSGVTITGGSIVMSGSSQFLMAWDGGGMQTPIRLTFDGDGLAREELALAPVEGVDPGAAGPRTPADELTGPSVAADFNGDGLVDLLAGEFLYLGGPGGGFTPILAPDAVIYGALRLTPGLPTTAPTTVADALASTQQR